jgi:hypothetical protein
VLQDDDDEGEGDDGDKPAWHKRPVVLLHIAAFGLSVVLLIIGLCTQYVPAMAKVRTRPEAEACD